jgi:hypothetical protein
MPTDNTLSNYRAIIDAAIDEHTFGFIYLIICNGVPYVGLTAQNSKYQRIYNHIWCVGNGENTHFYNAIRKYGFNNTTFEVIDTTATNLSELRELEKHYIQKYDSYNNGHNKTIGGEGTLGFKHSEEFNQAISARMILRFADPEEKRKQSERTKTYFANNPEEKKKQGERTKIRQLDNPELMVNHSIFMKEYSNLPENKERSRDTMKKYHLQHPTAVSEQQTEIWQRDGYNDKMSNIKKQRWINLPQEEKDKILNKLHSGDHTEHYTNLKKIKNTPEEKERFTILIANDRISNPTKYEEAKLKRRTTMNTSSFKDNMSKIKRKTLEPFNAFEDGRLIGTFTNIVDCIKALKQMPTKPSIIKCLNGDLGQSLGYTFKYVETDTTNGEPSPV